MAEIWGAAIVAAGAIYSSEKQAGAAKKAAGAQQRAADQAIAATQQNYDRTKSDLQPYITLGGDAAGTLGALNSGDFSAFHADPGYQFAFNQGLQGLDRSAASRGSLYSGGHSADLIRYGQGMADQQYGQFYNRLMGLAGMGQNASSNLGSVGTGNAASIGSNLTNAANAAASGYINSANAQSNLYGQLAGAFGQYMGNRGSNPTTTSYSLGGNGAQSYQVNDGSFQNNGTFNFAKAGV
ncbi:hypothetical protein [Frateuria sp.]|uniref:hypothetical protein n=1 Tax=Frateuria sp. TaxID=2211372 RepID=UPI003F7EC41D